MIPVQLKGVTHFVMSGHEILLFSILGAVFIMFVGLLADSLIKKQKAKHEFMERLDKKQLSAFHEYQRK